MPLAHVVLNLFWQIRRRRLLAAGVTLALVASAAAYLVLAPLSFTARTTLLAKFGREFSFRGDGEGGAVVPPSLVADDIVGSVIQIMNSQMLIDQVVDEIGVATLYPKLVAHPPQKITPRQAAVLTFARHLSIAQVKRSNVIEATFTHTDPRIAARALNLFVAAFQKEFLDLYGDKSLSFLEARTKDLTQVYDAAEARLAQFQADNPAWSKDDQPGVLEQRRADLEVQLARLERCCAGSDATDQLKSELAVTNGQITAMRKQQDGLAELEHQRAVAQQMLDGARRRLDEATASHEMDVSGLSSVTVIDRADVPAQAQKPSRSLRMIGAALISAVIGLCVALLAETMRRRFSTAAELESYFKVPVLSEVQLISTGRRAMR